MFILLLILSQVSCDWVEISQNLYRKDPVHQVQFDYTTKSNRIYKNNSITEKQWHRGVVDKVSKGNIRPVQHPSVKTSPVKIRHEDDRFNHNNDYKTPEINYSFVSAKPNIQKFNANNEDFDQNRGWTTSAYIDQVPSKHPFPKPIKKLESLITNNLDRRKVSNKKYTVEENDAVYQEKQVQIMQPPLANSKKNMDELDFSENDKFFTRTSPNLHRLYLDDDSKFTTSSVKFHNKEDLSTPKIRLIDDDDARRDKVNEFKRVMLSDTEKANEIKYKSPKPLGESNSRENFESPVSNIGLENKYNTETSEALLDIPIQNNAKIVKSSLDEVPTYTMAEDYRSKIISNVTNSNTMKGMWKLMKLVTETIYKNTHRSFKGKIQYLENLKTTILKSIEDQIDRAWPDDKDAALSSRHARAAQARGHVEFPSSESTLMTISFLTFAVFVIKLVLQVIHTYKNKTMMVTPAVVAAVGRAAAAFKTST